MNETIQTSPSPIPPRPAPDAMASVAAGQGIGIDVVDAGGQNTMERPETALLPRGPIANSLDGRMTGSSAEVDQAGADVQQTNHADVDERVGGVEFEDQAHTVAWP